MVVGDLFVHVNVQCRNVLNQLQMEPVVLLMNGIAGVELSTLEFE